MTHREVGPPCPNCLKPVMVGQVVLPWDDVGEMHADCERPYRTDHTQQPKCPAPYVLIGDPMRLVPLAALASAPAGDHVPDAGNMIAPAGDGVEDVAERLFNAHRQRLGLLTFHYMAWSEMAESDQIEWADEARMVIAALARPRAAVGERNHLVEIVTEAIHDHAADDAGTARDHAAHAVTRILALQSPPAKVDG